jgi:hypothetical protein
MRARAKVDLLGGAMERFEGVTDHRGETRRPDAELFAAPPAEIGRVVSAESTLRAGKSEMVLPLRLLVSLVPGTLVTLAILWAAVDPPFNADPVQQGLALAAGVALAAIIWYFTRFSHRCSYVGEDGIALFTLRGRRDAQPSPQVMRFEEVAELCAPQTRHYLNGVYAGTEYDFRWRDAAGKQRMRLKGRYVGQNKPPRAGDAYHFAAAAEAAWSNHFLARAAGELERTGAIPFRIEGKGGLRVGPGFIEFHFGDEPVRVTSEEIANVTLGDGQFSFVHKDAKWYRSAGKYRFPYGGMGNGRVFFLALEKLMGYQWN